MSAYKTISCNLVDKQTLLVALSNMGLNYTVHETPQKLEGYMGDKRNQTAEIVVKRADLNRAFTGCSNDLGFKWNTTNNQYDVIVSDYDAGMSGAMDKRITQAYAEAAIDKALKANKFTVQKTAGDVKQRARNTVSIMATRII